MRGYFGIGIYNPKSSVNMGTLFRGAYGFRASHIFTIGKRYKKEHCDTTKTYRHVPLYNYTDFEDFYCHIPKDCVLVGVDIDEAAHKLDNYIHPERAIYLLGAEDIGLPQEVRDRCNHLVMIPKSTVCLNVSVAGSIIMYDRSVKNGTKV